MSMKKERRELLVMLDEAITIANIMKGRAWTQKWTYHALKQVDRTIEQLKTTKSFVKSIPKNPDA